jgi:hypothetical protein
LLPLRADVNQEAKLWQKLLGLREHLTPPHDLSAFDVVGIIKTQDWLAHLLFHLLGGLGADGGLVGVAGGIVGAAGDDVEVGNTCDVGKITEPVAVGLFGGRLPPFAVNMNSSK